MHECTEEELLRMNKIGKGTRIRYCVSNRDNITLWSNPNYRGYTFIEFLVVECENGTSNVVCKPRDQIIDYIRHTTVMYLNQETVVLPEVY